MLSVRKIILYIIIYFQVTLFLLSYLFFSIIRKFIKFSKVNWAVGTEETASNIHNISTALTDTISVCLSTHPFTNYRYDFVFLPNFTSNYIRLALRLLFSPCLFGYLCHRANGFIYIAGSGYFITQADGRWIEFFILQFLNKKIVCYFCGSEIRSLKLMKQLSIDLDRDTISTYQTISVPNFDSERLEQDRKNFARSADKFAAHIFNAPIDQLSYIKRPVHPFIYFYPDIDFHENKNKYKNLENIIIVHGPSSPLIKGTPLVRAAIKKLKMEGYKFEYKELIGVKHTEMLKALYDAHIVLNEFYAFVPGQFGVEAMANYCALLTSADENIELSLPRGSNNAWLVTEYWNIYDNLKKLLDNPTLMVQLADAGYYWAIENCSHTVNAQKLDYLLSRDPDAVND